MKNRGSCFSRSIFRCTAYSQICLNAQSQEGSRFLSASESWQKPRANQSLSVEYFDSPYSSPESRQHEKTKCFCSHRTTEDDSLLVGPALDHHSFFFRVNQIIARRDHSQTIDPILASDSPSTAAIQSEVPSLSRLKISNLERILSLQLE